MRKDLPKTKIRRQSARIVFFDRWDYVFTGDGRRFSSVTRRFRRAGRRFRRVSPHFYAADGVSVTSNWILNNEG